MFTGFRFRREINVLPWLQFNISKTGVSATIGPELAHVTVGAHGTYVYMDMPGKGTYFRRKLGPMLEDLRSNDDENAQKENPQGEEGENPQEEAGLPIDLNFLDRLMTRPKEVAFADAVNALDAGDEQRAYNKAREAASLADGAYLAGFLALEREEWPQAVEYFERALEDREHLGELFARVQLDMRVFVSVTKDFMVAIRPNRRDCLLALAIAHERMDHNELTIKRLQTIREEYDPDDLIIRLLLAELLDETYPENARVQHEVVTLAEGVQNDSPLHAALMLYRGRALRRLGVVDGARDTFTKALRKKKDYPTDLLVALRYERALLYEAEGDEKKAHKEFEKIYALAPDLEDVAERIGVESEIKSDPLPEPLARHPPTENPPGEQLAVDYNLGSTQEEEEQR
ncbi:MAG: DUF4236 domain-containing protein [Anaerolineae bacterium]|nr:DUF4236 domain-containing protein [Anaerolineae bacterium]